MTGACCARCIDVAKICIPIKKHDVVDFQGFLNYSSLAETYSSATLYNYTPNASCIETVPILLK